MSIDPRQGVSDGLTSIDDGNDGNDGNGLASSDDGPNDGNGFTGVGATLTRGITTSIPPAIPPAITPTSPTDISTTVTVTTPTQTSPTIPSIQTSSTTFRESNGPSTAHSSTINSHLNIIEGDSALGTSKSLDLAISSSSDIASNFVSQSAVTSGPTQVIPSSEASKNLASDSPGRNSITSGGDSATTIFPEPTTATPPSPSAVNQPWKVGVIVGVLGLSVIIIITGILFHRRKQRLSSHTVNTARNENEHNEDLQRIVISSNRMSDDEKRRSGESPRVMEEPLSLATVREPTGQAESTPVTDIATEPFEYHVHRTPVQSIDESHRPPSYREVEGD